MWQKIQWSLWLISRGSTCRWGKVSEGQLHRLHRPLGNAAHFSQNTSTISRKCVDKCNKMNQFSTVELSMVVQILMHTTACSNLLPRNAILLSSTPFLPVAQGDEAYCLPRCRSDYFTVRSNQHLTEKTEQCKCFTAAHAKAILCCNLSLHNSSRAVTFLLSCLHCLACGLLWADPLSCQSELTTKWLPQNWS